MTENDTLIIFTDAATSPQKGIAVGAFLFVKQEQLDHYAAYNIKDLYEKLTDKIIYKEFQSKKSTWSEIKTVIEALMNLPNEFRSICKIEIYTDCQNVCDLLGRRKEKLLKNNFITRSGNSLAHADLYKDLFTLAEKFQIQVFKLKGHQSVANHLSIKEKIFVVLDKLSRVKLRSLIVE